MTSSHVTHVRPGKSAKRQSIRINGPDATFRIKHDAIEEQFKEPLNDLQNDLLEIASSVFFADTTFPRGGDSRPQMGVGWQRNLNFELAVRQPEIWRRPEITDALKDAIEFMTGDSVSFEFTNKAAAEPAEPYLPFDPNAAPYQADEVILFSGGLDSFAGALEALKVRTGKVILVTHRSAPKAITRQNDLGEYLKRKFGGRILHVHVRATRSGRVSKESTQRSRSLLFTALGYVVAKMAGAPQVSFYENGVVSHNLPISPQVVGTMASRTTHPLVIKKLQALLDLLEDGSVRLLTPFEWLTKTDVVRKIDEFGASCCISKSVSCTTLRNESKETHHCGVCSQCIDRRFAILAAGLEEHDRSGDYKTDVIAGERETPRNKTLALEWVRHAGRLADMSIMEFAQRFSSDLVRITSAYSDLTSNEVVEKCFNLHRIHGRTVQKTIEKEIEKRKKSLSRGEMPPTSLLALFIGNAQMDIPTLDDSLTLIEAPSGEPAPVTLKGDVPPSLFPLLVAFYFNEKPPRHIVEVSGLGFVRGAPAAVAHNLKPYYEEDLAAGLAPENHRYISPGELATTRRYVSRNTVSQQVKRCRKELAEFYQAVMQEKPDRDLLIENFRPKGYRLDPLLRIVRRDQVSSER
jgi:7-cyano-7-deazaguanine synthase in queuosine biosynthesis